MAKEIERRARVKEWRITRRLYRYTVRYWIESDPEHGGVATIAEAIRAASEAEIKVLEDEDTGARNDPGILGGLLLDACACANSLEVCDSLGFGVAVHRDWP